ncbi:MAG: hypothetical protein MI867_02950, partial [Pseudomonadales bacterium]|nr:hypothetical protein [Pseudomonadales bacterium]
MEKRFGKILMTVLAGLLLVNCGGGSSGSSGGLQIGGIDRLGVSAGTVTGFGSIFVNGVEFDTDDADFDIDDDDIGSSQDDLDVGDTVIVTFDPDVAGNVALTVFSDEAVEGPIDSIDLATGVLVVVG